MDVLYVLGDGSRHSDIELRMSIRSICKYAENLGKVIVAGKPPAWLSNEVVSVPVADKYSYKHSNILRCIEKVVDLGLVKGDFLYSSDDHFYVKAVDFNNYPYYIKATHFRTSAEKGDCFYPYHRSLVDTRKLLEAHGLPARNYSQHCNTHMNAEVIKAIRDLIHESYSLEYGVEPTSLIMNAWQTYLNPPPLTPRKDCKISKARTVADIWTQIGTRDCFSIGDSVFAHSAIRDFFKEEYSAKCIFEC